MSRCIPFPPPGYVWHGASGQGLLMSIKIWREKVAALKKRKEEGKRKRKQENGELEEGEIRKERCSHKHEKSKKVGDCQMNEEYENEMSDASNLTEEHDQSICCYSLCDSSGNTENIEGKISVTSVIRDLSPMPYLCGSSTAVEKAETAAAFSSSERRLQDIEAKLGELFTNAALPPFGLSCLSLMIKNGSLAGNCPEATLLKCLMLGITIHLLTTCLRLVSMFCLIH